MNKFKENAFRKSLRRRLMLLKEEESLMGAEDFFKADAQEEKITPIDTEGMTSAELIAKQESGKVFRSVAAKEKAIETAQAQVDSIKKGPLSIDRVQASAYADAIYEATKGGFLDLGFGTDETAISKITNNQALTCVDMSFISKVFEETYENAWTFHPTLNAVFASEFRDAEMRQYVIRPLLRMKEERFIKIGDAKIGFKEFFSGFVENGEQAQQAFAGKDRGGWQTGILSYFTDPTFDDSAPAGQTDDSYDPTATSTAGTAAGQLVKYGAAASPIWLAPPPGMPPNAANKFTAAIKQDYKNFLDGAKAAGDNPKELARQKKLFKQRFKETYKASLKGMKKTKRKAQKSTKAATKEALKIFDDRWSKTGRNFFRKAALEAGQVGGKKAFRKGVQKSMQGAAKVSLARLGPKMATMGITKVGVRAIPWVGWSLLAYDIYEMFTAGDIPADIDMILNSTMYSQIEVLFEKMEQKAKMALEAVQQAEVVTDDQIKFLEEKEKEEENKKIQEEEEKKQQEEEEKKKEEDPGDGKDVFKGTNNNDPWEYKVNMDTGCWLTRRQGTSGGWISLSNNRRATQILDDKFPDARSPGQRSQCPGAAKSSGSRRGGGSSGGGVAVVPSRRKTGSDASSKRPVRVFPSSSARNYKDLRIRMSSAVRGFENIRNLSDLNPTAANLLKQKLVENMPESKLFGGDGRNVDPERKIRIIMKLERGKVRLKAVGSNRNELNRTVKNGDDTVFRVLNTQLSNDQKKAFKETNGIHATLTIIFPVGNYTSNVSAARGSGSGGPEKRKLNEAYEESLRLEVRKEIFRQLMK